MSKALNIETYYLVVGFTLTGFVKGCITKWLVREDWRDETGEKTWVVAIKIRDRDEQFFRVMPFELVQSPDEELDQDCESGPVEMWWVHSLHIFLRQRGSCIPRLSMFPSYYRGMLTPTRAARHFLWLAKTGEPWMTQ